MSPQTAINWLLALAIAAILSISYLLDGPTDHRAERAQAQSLSDAQRADAAALRRDLAAAKLCREQFGEATFQWTYAGDLVCIPRKGVAVAFAKGGAL